MRRVRSILLVSCPDALRTHLATRIEPKGWICVCSSTLREAKHVLHEVRPAIVLVGFEEPSERTAALRGLRADPFVAGVPVLTIADGRPVADEHWIGAQLDGLRAGAAREVYAALDALLATVTAVSTAAPMPVMERVPGRPLRRAARDNPGAVRPRAPQASVKRVTARGSGKARPH